LFVCLFSCKLLYRRIRRKAVPKFCLTASTLIPVETGAGPKGTLLQTPWSCQRIAV